MDKAIVTTSWDDGHPLDLKLAELLQKYDVPATFYIPICYAKRGCMNPQQIREIAARFDVGGHSYHHIRLTKVPPEAAEKELKNGKKELQEITGKEVISFSYPYGNFNNGLIRLARDAGFIGARTLMLLTRTIRDPFREGTMANAGNSWFTHYLLHSLASRDPHLSLFVLKNNLFLKGWEKIALETLRFVVDNGGIWHLWGHSWEIEENGDWARLERVFQEINGLSEQILKKNNSQLLQMYKEKSG
jgi:peptidoglycan/xylan/chitin deacetylase (PgdA/CDA1 family)